MRADEYPQGAGRICNAPSSRTAALGIGPYIFYRRFSDFHTLQVQSKALVDGGAGEPFERFPGRLFPFLIETERRPSTAVGFREGRRRLRIWSFRRPGGSGMEQASSDAAAVLFFLRKEKEKNGGRKKRRWASAHLSISLLFALQVTPIISQRYLAGARRRRRTRRPCRGRSARR